MQPLELIVIGIAALGCYWAWRFFHKDDKARIQPLFSCPTIKDGGPAYKPNGEINWDSDEPIRSPEARVTMYYESIGVKHRCPKCGSRKWRCANQDKTSADVSDVIFCHDCLDLGDYVGGTDNPEVRRGMESKGFFVYPLSEWRLGEVV